LEAGSSGIPVKKSFKLQVFIRINYLNWIFSHKTSLFHCHKAIGIVKYRNISECNEWSFKVVKCFMQHRLLNQLLC
jgi:hypothetical protein